MARFYEKHLCKPGPADPRLQTLSLYGTSAIEGGCCHNADPGAWQCGLGGRPGLQPWLSSGPEDPLSQVGANRGCNPRVTNLGNLQDLKIHLAGGAANQGYNPSNSELREPGGAGATQAQQSRVRIRRGSINREEDLVDSFFPSSTCQL